MAKYILAFSVVLFVAAFSSININEIPTSLSLKYSIDNIDGSISGTVTVPDQSTARRQFRGSSYRSRGTSSSGSTSSSDSAPEEGSKFMNTIVSAHPLSYSISDDISGEPVIIGQKDATFLPNVTPVAVGTVVQFINDDPFFHNVFSLTPGSKFNIGRRQPGDVFSKQIEAPKWKVTGIGPITLFCDVHSQMKATILSLDTPYFTRLNEDGTYRLSNLPDGDYEIRVFNPSFDIISKTISIQSDNITETNFNLAN
jgi:plastocyanin